MNPRRSREAVAEHLEQALLILGELPALPNPRRHSLLLRRLDAEVLGALRNLRHNRANEAVRSRLRLAREQIAAGFTVARPLPIAQAANHIAEACHLFGQPPASSVPNRREVASAHP